MFKKIILSLAITLSIFNTVPKAQAGLLIGTFVDPKSLGTIAIATGIGAAAGVGFAALLAVDQGDWSGAFSETLPLVLIPAILLDVDGTLSQDKLALAFHKQYPFIDNSEALSNLASAVKEKASIEAQNNPETKNMFISLSREEVASALETADISQEQFEQIASDLK